MNLTPFPFAYKNAHKTITHKTITHKTITMEEFLQAFYTFLINTEMVSNPHEFLCYLYANEKEVQYFVDKFRVKLN